MPEGNKIDPSGYQAATGRLMVYSQLIGVLAATITRGDADIGAAVAANATEYNYLKHLEMAKLNQEFVGCDQRADCDAIGAKFFDKHQANEKTLAEVCKVSKDGCIKGAVEIYEAVYGFQSGEYPNELDSRGRAIQAAFHVFNLDARSDTTGSIIAPTAEQFMAAMGLDPNNPNVKVAAGGLASIVAGKVGGKGQKGTRPSAEPFYKTTQQATQAAEALGYKKLTKPSRIRQYIRRGTVLLQEISMGILAGHGRWQAR